MEYKICEKCNMVFKYLDYGPVLCPACLEKDNELLKKAQKYLEAFPDAKESDVAQAVGVEIRDVKRWESNNDIHLKVMTGFACKMCGRKITSGKLCKQCQINMMESYTKAGHFTQSSQQKETRSNAGMRFMQRKK